jgi:hypothetical protein
MWTRALLVPMGLTSEIEEIAVELEATTILSEGHFHGCTKSPRQRKQRCSS